MYIAFRWLLFLTLCMWFALCWIEESKKYYKRQYECFLETKKQKILKNHDHGLQLITFFNSIIFIFGALTVIVCTKGAETVVYLKNYKYNNLFTIHEHCNESFKKLLKFLSPYWVSAKIFIQYLLERAAKLIFQMQEKCKQKQNECQLSEVLLKKLTTLKAERDKMVKVLIAAVKANKCIKEKRHLNSTVGDKFVRNIADSNLQLRDDKAKIFTNFYCLYVMCHRENILLKARLRSAVHERDGAHDLLRQLVKEIFKSNNIQLKLFCIRFAAHLGDTNLVNATRREVAYSTRPESDKPASSKEQLNETESVSCAKSRFRARVNEIIKQKGNDLFKSNKRFAKEPKNKNNRYIWTVQNQNGLIENVYEYYDELDQTKSVNVKRIRQYSVYHKRDCIFDLSNSNSSSECNYHLESSVIEFPTNPRFLTNSEAFQNFLKNYKSIPAKPQLKSLKT